MNNLENAAECARRAMVFYEEGDQESLGTALKLLYARLIKKDPDDKSGSNGEGCNETDDEFHASIKPWIVY